VRRLIVTEIRLKAKIRILENHFTSTLAMIIDGLIPDSVHTELVGIQVTFGDYLSLSFESQTHVTNLFRITFAL